MAVWIFNVYLKASTPPTPVMALQDEDGGG